METKNPQCFQAFQGPCGKKLKSTLPSPAHMDAHVLCAKPLKHGSKETNSFFPQILLGAMCTTIIFRSKYNF
jgi:hypothetical protein